MEDTAAARSFFEEGLRRADRGDWKGAADRFERTLALRYSPTVAFNLAKARIELGELVAATELLLRIQRDPDAPSNVRASAKAAEDHIAPRIGRLVLEADGSLEGITLTMDGRTVSPAQLGAPIPADPGRRVLEARRGDELVASGETELQEGGEASIIISIPPPPPAPALPELEPDGEDDPVTTGGPAPITPVQDDDGGVTSEAWFWLVIGAVVIGAGVAGTLLVTSQDDADPVVQGDFMPGVIEL